MTKREKVIYYAEQQTKNGSTYIWAGQGQLLKDLTDKDIEQMEQSPEQAAEVFKHVGREYFAGKLTKKSKAFDCSGLAIMALIYAKVLKKGFDTTADELMHKFPKPNTVKPGDLVFMTDQDGHAYHVGILKDLSTVIEAKGRPYGIVESPYNSKWTEVRTPY